jgi:hypothetical protein
MAIRTTKQTTKPKAKAKVTTKKTTVVTPKAKFQGTPGKSYIIAGPDNQRTVRYGTEAQADSSYAAKYKWNNTRRDASGQLWGKPTKQGYQARPSAFSNMTKAQIAALPDYVAPKNTGAGPLKRSSDVSKSTGYGKCEPGYVLRNGRCVPK